LLIYKYDKENEGYTFLEVVEFLDSYVEPATLSFIMRKFGDTCPLNLDHYFKKFSQLVFNEFSAERQGCFHILAFGTNYLLAYIPETTHAYFLSLHNFTVKAIIKFAKKIKTIRIKNLREIQERGNKAIKVYEYVDIENKREIIKIGNNSSEEGYIPENIIFHDILVTVYE